MKIKKHIWEEVIFFNIPLFLLGINYVLYNALAIDSMKILLRVIAILLLVIGWALKGKFRIDKKTFLALILAILSLVINGRESLNFTVIVLFSICSTYSMNKIIKNTFIINTILVLLMILLMAFRVVDNTSYVSTMGRLRYTLGFENSNVAALFYSSAIYLLIISRKKLTKIVIAISFLMATIIFYYTNSRTSLIALMAFIVLESLYIFLKKRDMQFAQQIFGKCSILIVDIMFVLNLISIFIIDKFMIFDELFSYRISTFSKMINVAGLKGFLFGGVLESVDNFYYMLLFQYGIVIYIFVAISTHFIMKKMVTDKNIKYISLFVGLFLVGMMESSLIRPEILITLVVWKMILSGNNNFSNNVEISEEMI